MRMEESNILVLFSCSRKKEKLTVTGHQNVNFILQLSCRNWQLLIILYLSYFMLFISIDVLVRWALNFLHPSSRSRAMLHAFGSIAVSESNPAIVSSVSEVFLYFRYHCSFCVKKANSNVYDLDNDSFRLVSRIVCTCLCFPQLVSKIVSVLWIEMFFFWVRCICKLT